MTSFPALTQLNDRMSAVFQGNSVASSVALIIGLIIMLAFCFYGYKAMRQFASVAGFLTGWVVGYGILVPAFQLQNEWVWIVPLITAVILAALGFFFYRVGLFIAIFSSVYSSLLPILSGTRVKAPYPMVIAFAAALVLAILGVKLLRGVIIFATAYAGAFGAIGILFDNWIHLGVGAQETMMVRLVLGAVIGTIGLIYQFRDSR